MAPAARLSQRRQLARKHSIGAARRYDAHMGGKAVNAVDEVLHGAPDLGVDSPQPAHVRIEAWLTSVIGSGALVPGDKLPREETLAAALGVSRMTLRQALATLEGLGTILRKPGRLGGTFVAEPKIVCDLTGLAGFTEQMRRANLRAGARVVSATTKPASRTAARALGLDRHGTRARDRPGALGQSRAARPGERVLSRRTVPRPARRTG